LGKGFATARIDNTHQMLEFVQRNGKRLFEPAGGFEAGMDELDLPIEAMLPAERNRFVGSGSF